MVWRHPPLIPTALTATILPPRVTVSLTGGGGVAIEERAAPPLCVELVPHTGQLLTALLGGITGRHWEGKDALLTALADVLVHCRTYSYGSTAAATTAAAAARVVPVWTSASDSVLPPLPGGTIADPVRVIQTLVRIAGKPPSAEAPNTQWRCAAAAALGRVCAAFPDVVAFDAVCAALLPLLKREGVVIAVGDDTVDAASVGVDGDGKVSRFVLAVVLSCCQCFRSCGQLDASMS